MEKRLWGVAVSHYQVEGDDECDWTEWEKEGRARERCGKAAGSWERYEEDVALAAAAGANAFRFSVSWSRVEPQRGRFDEGALDRYRRLVEELRRASIEPVVTLFHYTHPTWFHRETPWSSPQSIDAFSRFARRVAESFGTLVHYYTILNEPLVFVLAGYVDGQIPPGYRDAGMVGRALENLLRAHVAAAASIREVNPAALIGIAHNMMAFAPERLLSPLDWVVSRLAHRFYNVGMIEAFRTGRWDLILPPSGRFRGVCPELLGSLDFFGVNYYSRLHFRCPGKERFIGDFRYLDRTGRGLTDNGWEIVPEALGPLLRLAGTLGLPLMITENGLADARDSSRSSFIEEHVRVIRTAEKEGLPIRGYFHWSLLDNFEWLDGYGPRFGLYEVDRSTFARTPRPSVETFRREGRQFLSGA